MAPDTTEVQFHLTDRVSLIRPDHEPLLVHQALGNSATIAGLTSGIVLIIAILLASCEPSEEQAGLTGPNPVVSISHYFGPNADFAIDETIRAHSNGLVHFSGQQIDRRPITHELTTSREAFRDLAISLGYYRMLPGTHRTMAEKCNSWISDTGGQEITWTYADGRQGTIIITACYDGETKRIAPLIRVLDKHIPREWRLEVMRSYWY